jgi:F420-0:gamma-glutamyl ligase-like protein
MGPQRTRAADMEAGVIADIGHLVGRLSDVLKGKVPMVDANTAQMSAVLKNLSAARSQLRGCLVSAKE